MAILTQEQKRKIVLMNDEGVAHRIIAKEVLGSETRKSSVSDFLKREEANDIKSSLSEEEQYHLERTLVTNQKQRDMLRVSRKHTRELSRAYGFLEELNNELVKVFKEKNLSKLTHPKLRGKEGCVVGVVHLSDLHFGEVVHELCGNVFDLDMASSRIRAYVQRVKGYFNALGVHQVLVALTGDLMNSDRRLDEVTSNAANRSSVLLTSVDILQQAILDLNKDFDVVVSSVVGNESRLGKEVGWTDFTASDSFDYVIHNVLSRLFEGSRTVKFIPMNNPSESLVNVNGKNFLLVHGHNGLANTTRMENEVAKVKTKYMAMGQTVDYVLAGHIHCLEKETEVATPRGFVPLFDVSVGDVVYAYQNGQVVETVVKHTHQGKHTGYMYQFESMGLHQNVTDGHYMYLNGGDYVPVKDFIANRRFDELVKYPNPLENNQEYAISDEWLRFLVAFCADGSYDRRGGSSSSFAVRFHLKKERKIQRLIELGIALGEDIKFGALSKTGSRKTLAFSPFFREEIEKFIGVEKKIPQWFTNLSSRQAKVVIDELHHWDGVYNNKKTQHQFCSTKPEEIEIVQSLMLRCGILSKVTGKRKCQISYSFTTEREYNQKIATYTPTFVVDKEVGCLTTDTKNFFIRTANGSVELSGNSAYISDTFARSSGLPGNNTYSHRALNLTGRSSQNAYVVHADGSIDGFKIDLQEVVKGNGYALASNEHLKVVDYKDTVSIQSVLI